MRFDPIRPQKFDLVKAGGRLDTADAVIPTIERIERAAKSAGLTCEVKVREDGSLGFSTRDLALATVIETQRHGVLTLAEIMQQGWLNNGGKIRCQATQRDSTSFAAFIALGSDGKPFTYDSGTGTKHWLNDDDWASINYRKPIDDQVTQQKFEYANFSKLKTDVPPLMLWLLREWLPIGSVVVLFSPGGFGKSLLAQIIGTHVTAGIDMFGQKITQGPVLGYLCEDDNDELRRRQDKINDALQLNETPVGLYLEGRAGKHNTLFVFDAKQKEAITALLLQIDEECAIKKPVLLIIDNIAQVFAGMENDRHQVTVFCNELTRIAKKHRCCVLLLGHTAKAEGSQYSGSTAWEAAVRTRLWLNRNEDGTLELRKAKANYSALDSVTLQWHDGYLRTLSCGQNAPNVVSEKAKEAIGLALRDFTLSKIPTSNSPQARNYLPKMMLDAGKLFSLNLQTAKKTLSEMVDRGEVIPNSELGWKTPSRHPATGLKLANAEAQSET